MSEDRALMSEDLIRQAMTLYKEKENNLGLAEAHFAYGNLYKHPTYHKHATIFKKLGTYDATYNKSISNYKKSVHHFEKAHSEIGAIKSLVSIGEAYNLMGKSNKACTHYEKALSRYTTGKNSGAIHNEPVINVKGATNIGQIIIALMKRDKCT